MDNFLLDYVTLENNTMSKEESKSQKVRLRGLYDTIINVVYGKGEEVKNKAD